MDAELISIQFNKIMQSSSYTVFILGTKNKQFAIYTSPHVGKHIQMSMANQIKPRPYTYDLINSVFRGLKVKILHVVINDVQDTIYYARIFVEQQTSDKKQIMEIDARPSDCLSLAIDNNVPIYCTKEVFNKVIPIDS